MNPGTPQIHSGIFSMIEGAGTVGKLVLLLLAVASLYSWAIIFFKRRTLKAANSENAKFHELFWNGKDMDDIFTRSERYKVSPVAAVFKAGVQELRRIRAEVPNLDSQAVENIGRALARATNREVTHLEKHLGWLATIASASPFVGLFGTVWGIMWSFQAIGASGSANLAVVAPGISEALIATAIGIGAAVPALVGYNLFAGQIKRQAVDMDGFSQDFLNIVQRNALKRG